MNKFKVALVLNIVSICMVGCSTVPSGRSYDQLTQPEHKESGVIYKIVIIEGQQYIATRSYNDYIILAGPIN